MAKRRTVHPTDAPEQSLGRITFVENRGGYQFLWLKRVSGVNLDKHCIDCLLGSRDWRVDPGIAPGRVLSLRPGIYYLCGVGFTWSSNAHLAFTWHPGTVERHYLPFPLKATTKTGKARLIVELENFARVAFGEDAVARDHPFAGLDEYRTCRNWQFAHFLKRHGAKDNGRLWRCS